MLFHNSDRDKINDILIHSECHQNQLIKVLHSQEHLQSTVERLARLIESAWNEIEVLKAHIIALEKQSQPKPATPSKSHKKK